MKKKIATILPLFLLLANTATAFADVSPKSSDVSILGSSQATVVSFTVPQNVDFVLNPNGKSEQERFISSNFKISNDCNAPLSVSVNKFDNSPVSPHKFNNVSPDKYTKDEWGKLNYEKSMSEIALGVVPVDANEWRDSKAKTIYAYEKSVSETPIELGALNPNTSATFKLTANHGNSFSALQSKYLVTFIFDLYSKEPFITDQSNNNDGVIDLTKVTKLYEVKPSTVVLSSRDYSGTYSCFDSNNENIGTLRYSPENAIVDIDGKKGFSFTGGYTAYEFKDFTIDANTTVDYWIYPTAKTYTSTVMGSGNISHMAYYDGNSLVTLWTDNTQSYSKKELPLNKWSHVVVDAKNKQLYLNGENVTVNKGIGSWRNMDMVSKFGIFTTQFTPFQGYISDIIMYKAK